MMYVNISSFSSHFMHYTIKLAAVEKIRASDGTAVHRQSKTENYNMPPYTASGCGWYDRYTIYETWNLSETSKLQIFDFENIRS